MSYGLRVFDSAGNLSLDTNTFTYQVLGQWVVDFSASTTSTSVTLTIPGFDPSTCALVLLPARATDIPTDDVPTNKKCYPYVVPSSGQVVIYAAHPGTTASYGSQALMRAIAIKFA
ncbi:hypothetical protein [Pseudomonas putida]